MGTGLKKCRPPNLSNLSVDTAMSLIGSDEVLLVKIVSLKFYNYNLLMYHDNNPQGRIYVANECPTYAKNI